MRTGHSENTPDADNQRYKTCKRIHGKTVSSVQRGRIHSVNIRIYPISKQRPYLRTLCKQSPKELLIAPKWDIKNYVFTNRLIKEMISSGSYQGKLAHKQTM